MAGRTERRSPGGRDTFAELVARRPNWTEAQVNLAIATLNRQQEGDEQRALDVLSDVLEREPDNVRALYVTGLLRLYLGDTEASLLALRRVAELDPQDAYASYFIAQNLMQSGDLDAALARYQRALELDPYLRSAHYGAGLVLRRLGRAEEAREMLATYQRFADNPRARLAEFKYTRMGAKATALAVGGEQAIERARRPGGELFAAPREYAVASGTSPARLTVADVDGDGDLDLYRTGADGSLLLTATGGDYLEAPQHPLSGIPAVTAALWGDVDNDGDLDVYLCRSGPNQLWIGDADGDWTDASAATGTADAGRCADAGMLDADHDGDLDIFVVNSDGPDELFNNNMDGSFRRLATDQGIGGDGGGVQLLPADLDGDRDVDLLVIRPSGTDVWINDRLWQYRAGDRFDAFSATPVAAAVAADRDADGAPEIYAIQQDGALTAWSWKEAGEWAPSTIGRLDGDQPYLAVADFDGDGVPDLLAGSDAGVTIFTGEGETRPIAGAWDLTGPVLVLNDDPARGPSLVAPTAQGLRIWAPGDGRHAFLGVTVTGKEERAESMRSDRSGIGTRLSLRTLDRWTIMDTFDRHSAPGQSLQPVLFGLGGVRTADYLALDWSDGVFQTELDLAAGQVHRIAEAQRQLSSCPSAASGFWCGRASTPNRAPGSAS